MRRQISASFLALIVLCGSSTPSAAQDKASTLVSTAEPTKLIDGTCIVLPIYFATNRSENKMGNFLNSQRNLDATPSIGYGVANIRLSVSSEGMSICKLDRQDAAAMGWKIYPDTKLATTDVRSQNRLNKQAFFDAVVSQQEKSKHKKVLVFVHGCCVGHEEGLKAAARAAVWYGLPVVAFDWAASPFLSGNVEITSYEQNEHVSENSEDDFCEFMTDLESSVKAARDAWIQKNGGRGINSINVVAHSMGNRLVQSYLLRRAARDLREEALERVDMCNADVDAEKFARNKLNLERGLKRLVVYVNRRDLALSASEFKKANYPRLGKPGDSAKVEELWKSPKQGSKLDILDVTNADQRAFDKDVFHSPLWWLSSELYKYGALNGQYKTINGKQIFALETLQEKPTKVVLDKFQTIDGQTQVVETELLTKYATAAVKASQVGAIVFDGDIDAKDSEPRDLGHVERGADYTVKVRGLWTNHLNQTPKVQWVTYKGRYNDKNEPELADEKLGIGFLPRNPKLAVGALIFRVGSTGEWEIPDQTMSFKPTASGHLFAVMNDGEFYSDGKSTKIDGYTNNDGWMHVTITRIK